MAFWSNLFNTEYSDDNVKNRLAASGSDGKAAAVAYQELLDKGKIDSKFVVNDVLNNPAIPADRKAAEIINRNNALTVAESYAASSNPVTQKRGVVIANNVNIASPGFWSLEDTSQLKEAINNDIKIVSEENSRDFGSFDGRLKKLIADNPDYNKKEVGNYSVSEMEYAISNKANLQKENAIKQKKNVSYMQDVIDQGIAGDIPLKETFSRLGKALLSGAPEKPEVATAASNPEKEQSLQKQQSKQPNAKRSITPVMQPRKVVPNDVILEYFSKYAPDTPMNIINDIVASSDRLEEEDVANLIRGAIERNDFIKSSVKSAYADKGIEISEDQYKKFINDGWSNLYDDNLQSFKSDVATTVEKGILEAGRQFDEMAPYNIALGDKSDIIKQAIEKRQSVKSILGQENIQKVREMMESAKASGQEFQFMVKDKDGNMVDALADGITLKEANEIAGKNSPMAVREYNQRSKELMEQGKYAGAAKNWEEAYKVDYLDPLKALAEREEKQKADNEAKASERQAARKEIQNQPAAPIPVI